MDVTDATWRTSSYTGSGGGNCVEVGNHAQDRRVLIRDTKDRRGPVLAFNPQSWRNFTAEIKAQRPSRLIPPEQPGTSRRDQSSGHVNPQCRERCAGPRSRPR